MAPTLASAHRETPIEIESASASESKWEKFFMEIKRQTRTQKHKIHATMIMMMYSCHNHLYYMHGVLSFFAHNQQSRRGFTFPRAARI